MACWPRAWTLALNYLGSNHHFAAYQLGNYGQGTKLLCACLLIHEWG